MKCKRGEGGWNRRETREWEEEGRKDGREGAKKGRKERSKEEKNRKIKKKRDKNSYPASAFGLTQEWEGACNRRPRKQSYYGVSFSLLPSRHTQNLIFHLHPTAISSLDPAGDSSSCLINR